LYSNVNIEVSLNDVVEFFPDFTTFGSLRAFVPSWRRIPSDKNILYYVSGVKFSLEEGLVPCQAHYRPSVFNAQEELIVRKEIKTLLEKDVIKHSHHETGEFICTIFLRPKANGKVRMILDLKEFEKSVEHHHFKMDTLDTVIKMIKPGCYMASVDLKDATTQCLYTKTTKSF